MKTVGIFRIILLIQSTLSLYETQFTSGVVLVQALTANNNKAILTNVVTRKRDSRNTNKKDTMTPSGTPQSIATTAVLSASISEDVDGTDDPESGSAFATNADHAPTTQAEAQVSTTPAARATAIAAGTRTAMMLRDDEPYLYNVPSKLSMSYRPVPILTKSVVYVISIWFISMIMSFSQVNDGGSGSGGTSKILKNVLVKYPIQFLMEMVQTKNIRTILRWSISTLVFGVFITKCIQEYWFPPSRLTIQEMINQEEEIETVENSSNKIFPSSLSRYDTVTLRAPDAVTSASNSNNDDVEEATPDYQLQQEDDQQVELGVHYLKYSIDGDSDNGGQMGQTSDAKMEASDETRPKFQALYANHGFGASSLSWLPALPKLTKKIKARFGIAHDAVGFGFTERPDVQTNPNNRYYYTPRGSADIGLGLLQKHMSSSTKDPIVLFGHSMGSIATLHMALQLPSDTPKLIILAAPALGLRHQMSIQQRRRQEQQQEQPSAPATDSTDGNNGSNVVPQGYATTSRSPITAVIRSYVQNFIYPIACVLKLIKSKLIRPIFGAALLLVTRVQQILVRRLFDPIVIFFLRRMVGAPGFWKRGLQLCWGNSKLVTDSDALRFGWPSIGMGWEDGLLQFARAQAQYMSSPSETDAELFQQVLELPNTEIHIIIGGKDRVVTPAMVRQFLERVQNSGRNVEGGNSEIVDVSVPTPIVMDDIGHDAFEEDVDGFVEIVEQRANDFLSKIN